MYTDISVPYSPYHAFGDGWDRTSRHWRLIPPRIRWTIILGVTVALIIEPRILGWVFLAILVLMLGIVALILGTPLLSVVKARYYIAEDEKPLGLVLLDWGTKPFRLADSATDILEVAYEHLTGKN